MSDYKNFFITGIAGFIGFHLAKNLSVKFPNANIIGIDNINDYYSVKLKEDRLKELSKYKNITFIKGDIADFDFLQQLAKDYQSIDLIFHLAAQAGVRPSIDYPFKYVKSNLTGQVCILEFARLLPKLQKLIYASSSSVYGAFQKTPFKESSMVLKPMSLYAATKQADELMCDTYSRLFDLPMIGLRFFTAYGPWGRPDMAIYKIADRISSNKTVELVSDGMVTRDFTHISDIIKGVIKCIDYLPNKDEEGFQSEVFNLGTGKKVDINKLTDLIAKSLDIKANIKYIEANPTDMKSTLADISKAENLLGYKPTISLEEGVDDFIKWYKSYNN